MRPHSLRAALGLGLALLLGACGSPRPLGPEPLERRPAERAAVPTSSLHYRSYASADDLAAALRWTPDARPMVSAHRGAPVAGLPENSLEAFEHALNYAPALVEMDLRQSADGAIVLMHDETLDRTTTGTGPVASRTLAELRRLRLREIGGEPTPFRIPTLAEALAWADGRAVLLLDVKRGVPFPDVVAAVRTARAENRVVVIVYTLEAHRALARLAPDLNVSANVASADDADALQASGLDLSRVIAFAGVGVPEPAAVARLRALGVRTQAGTFRVDPQALAETDPALYQPFFDAGADVLSTDNIRGAAQAVQAEALRHRR